VQDMVLRFLIIAYGIMQDTDGFTFISKKKSSRGKKLNPTLALDDLDSPEDIDINIRRVNDIKHDLKTRDGVKQLLLKIDEARKSSTECTAVEISSLVCYGLGRPNSCRIASY